MKENSFLSPINILELKVVSLDLYTNPDYEGEVGDPVLGLSAHLELADLDKDLFLCQGVVSASSSWPSLDDDETESHHVASCIGILISAPKSSFSENIDREEQELILKANALSLAYSKIRCLIEDVTAQSIHGAITLPAIEPYSYLENKIEHD